MSEKIGFSIEAELDTGPTSLADLVERFTQLKELEKEAGRNIEMPGPQATRLSALRNIFENPNALTEEEALEYYRLYQRHLGLGENTTEEEYKRYQELSTKIKKSPNE